MIVSLQSAKQQVFNAKIKMKSFRTFNFIYLQCAKCKTTDFLFLDQGTYVVQNEIKKTHTLKKKTRHKNSKQKEQLLTLDYFCH